jgi:uncharacterized protein YutD
MDAFGLEQMRLVAFFLDSQKNPAILPTISKT